MRKFFSCGNASDIQQSFFNYFLIVWDLVREAKNRGMLHIGRGSAANSLVSYCLGFTEVDPLEFAKNKGLGLIVTQPDMYPIEDLGLIKIDLLSQRSLGVLKETMKEINEETVSAPASIQSISIIR